MNNGQTNDGSVLVRTRKRGRMDKSATLILCVALLSNVALSVLDEHIARSPGGPASGPVEKARRLRRGLPTFKLVRYADLCRARHKSAYAEARVMPTGLWKGLPGGRAAGS